MKVEFIIQMGLLVASALAFFKGHISTSVLTLLMYTLMLIIDLQEDIKEIKRKL